MTGYLVRRTGAIFPVLLLVSMIVFALIRVIPGDVVDIMMENLASGGEKGLEAKVAAKLRADLGLDKPIPVQYLIYVGDALRGDLGESVYRDRPVSREIMRAIPVSFELTIVAVVLALSISLPLGTISALRQDTWIDNTAKTIAIVGLSMPSFWTGTVLVVFMGLWWSYTPPILFVSPFTDPWANFQKVIFPAMILAIILAGSVARMVRSQLLEVLRQDYIRTAAGKGLGERRIVIKHALKNALIPVVTIIGLQFANLLGGTVIVETIFALPGLGRLTVDAISNRDYPVLQGTVLVFATTLLFMNLAIDILYSWLDPRIHYGGGRA